ncbi:hypothetical protein [Prevotella sp. KH2C16]|uniref:hypothetical protein n=1 Tax=Prevotella sp. KH2C16 TaxID=1855325 RepID=UPI0008E0DBFC|nr:hypothetical protein [Prevotella sp. KH2C16]SFG46128.1 hypothetical protein SAMN05216383_11532 [Prevotella sp. KH2C16]
MEHELKRLLDKWGHDFGQHLDTRKLWHWVRNHKHLSGETLDRLALLTGFQTWDDLQEALRGEGDASLNYEDDPVSAKK